MVDMDALVDSGFTGSLTLAAATVATLAMPAISVILFIANPPVTLSLREAGPCRARSSVLFDPYTLILPLRPPAAS